jgi:4-diphosphocytidyl-2-C-methyl-D-erythritol kinase
VEIETPADASAQRGGAGQGGQGRRGRALGGRIVELAPAKVNLTLEVLGRRADGYHELRSVVVFADIGDTLTFTPGGELRLETDGPFAQAVEGQNLVMKAAFALRNSGFIFPDGAFHLEKRLPVAAGLGGGSADAAAALRALFRAGGSGALEARRQTPFTSGPVMDDLVRLAASIGADVPVCLLGRAAVMEGIGERLRPLPAAPSLPAVLVNPGVKLSTREVFMELNAPCLTEEKLTAAGSEAFELPASLEELTDFLAARRNDLEASAKNLAPAVVETFAALRRCAGCLLARLSGSGPTCFGIFRSQEQARAAALEIAEAHPGWWSAAVTLG